MNHPERQAGMRKAGILLVTLVLVVIGVVLTRTATYAASGQENNTVLGHFAPFSDALNRSVVNVRIDGQPVATGLPYLGQVHDLELEPGTHEIVVNPTEWPGGTITETFDIPAPNSETLIDPGVALMLAGGTSSIPLDVVVQAIERAAPDSGTRVRFVHLAPFAPDGESDYTVCKSDGTVFFDMTSYGYGASSAYTDVPAGTYELYLASSLQGCDERLTPDIPITLRDKSVADLVAVGTNASPVFPNSLTIISVERSADGEAPELFLPMILK